MPKYKVKVRGDNRKTVGSRGDFGLQKSSKDAWKWVSWSKLKSASEASGGPNRLVVYLKLKAALGDRWVSDEEWVLDLAGAMKRAKGLIASGQADYVSIDAHAYRTMDDMGPRAYDVITYERGPSSNPRIASPPKRAPKKNPAKPGRMTALNKLTKV